VAGCCEYGDDPSGSGATNLVPITVAAWSRTWVFAAWKW
jgi:hypothetical protein